jgi:putative sigma-54 modulation protein
MRLVLTGRHVDVTPALRRNAERRLAKLDKLLHEGVVSAQVILSIEKYRQVIEVVVHVRGDHMLRAIAASTAWPTSLADAVEKLTQQAQKLKGKWEERVRQARTSKRVPESRPARRRPGIVRAAAYEVKPMAVAEAAQGVGDTPDAFVVFRNAETDAINVLYRRKGGGLGLIEPES